MYMWHLRKLHHRSIVYLVVAMIIVWLQIHTICLVAALVMIHSSWIHNIFLVAMTLLMESIMDLKCIVGSCA